MMKYISLMNPYSVYYLWEKGYKSFFINYINQLLKLEKKEEFVLRDFFNFEKNSVRSYVIFESSNHLVFIEFNMTNSLKIYEDDLELFNYMKKTENKNVIFVCFNNIKGEDEILGDIYNLYIKNDIFYAKSKKKQLTYAKEMITELYKMNRKMQGLYLYDVYLKTIRDKDL